MKNEEKKVNNTEETGVELTDEELAKVSGGLKLDPERLRKKWKMYIRHSEIKSDFTKGANRNERRKESK